MGRGVGVIYKKHFVKYNLFGPAAWRKPLPALRPGPSWQKEGSRALAPR